MRSRCTDAGKGLVVLHRLSSFFFLALWVLNKQLFNEAPKALTEVIKYFGCSYYRTAVIFKKGQKVLSHTVCWWSRPFHWHSILKDAGNMDTLTLTKTSLCTYIFPLGRALGGIRILGWWVLFIENYLWTYHFVHYFYVCKTCLLLEICILTFFCFSFSRFSRFSFLLLYWANYRRGRKRHYHLRFLPWLKLCVILSNSHHHYKQVTKQRTLSCPY